MVGVKRRGSTSRERPGSLSSSVDPDALSALFDPKDPKGLKSMGGPDGIAENLATDTEEGLPTLTSVERNRSAFGSNRLPTVPSKTLPELMLEALADRTLLMLCAGAAMSLALGLATHTAAEEGTWWIEGVAILAAVCVVVLVTSLNDFQKERQFRKLNAKKDAKEVKCVRAGRHVQVPVDEIVAGDVVILETGDIACADGLVVAASSLKLDESSATGESDALAKSPGGDPFVLSGTHVLEGYGRMVVAAVGTRSFEGRTMMSLRVDSEVTPLEAKLDVLAERIGRAGLAAAALVFVTLVARHVLHPGGALASAETLHALVRFFVSAITLVVVAVPEGLPLSVTIALAYSMVEMMRDQNLVRHLTACETMGGATCICTDKTGTLTQNRMAVVRGRVGGADFVTSGAGSAADAERAGADIPGGELREILNAGICVNSTAYEADGGAGFVGSKTEIALLGLSRLVGGDYARAREEARVEHLYPFSSKAKQMATVVRRPAGPDSLPGGSGSGSGEGTAGLRAHVKGAAEIVLAQCSHEALPGPGGSVKRTAISAARRAELEGLISEYATAALRTICVAYADVAGAPADWDSAPRPGARAELVLVGVFGIQDPLRPEVPGAVRDCQRAGITVRMVTGDNAVTAQNIARNCGIFQPGFGTVLEGPDFRKLSDAELDAALPTLQVLARSSPTDKQRLVGRLQALGEVVAVTGDGTNDAPALKMANVGFAMGIAGTEVAKEASDVILLDDNFASLLKACLWGRNVFDAIRKFLQFQLSVNLVAVVLSFVGAVLDRDGEPPLSATQMLFVNLIIDSFAALALATDRPSPDLLNRKPLGRAAPLITRSMFRNILGQAAFQLTALLALMHAPETVGLPVEHGSVLHKTVIFNGFVMMQLGNEIAARSIESPNVFAGILANRLFVAITVVTVAMQYVMVSHGGNFTQTAPLSARQWGACVALGIAALAVGIVVRCIPVNEPSQQNPQDRERSGNESCKTLMPPRDEVRADSSTPVMDALRPRRSAKAAFSLARAIVRIRDAPGKNKAE